MRNTEKVIEEFKGDKNCCQAVLSVYAERFGLEIETAMKLAKGFGGGIHSGEICGAVSGAVMVIGLMDKDIQDEDLIKDFIDKFSIRNKSIICKELLGGNPTIEAEAVIIKENDLFDKVCLKAVRDSVEIIDEIISR